MEKFFIDYYIDWVCDELRIGSPRPSHHIILFRKLNELEFYYSIELDRNRKEDGLYLRKRFINENIFDPIEAEAFDSLPITVFEVLAALAIRIDEQWLGDPDDPRPDIIFFEMLRNLDILRIQPDFEINRKVDRWLSRKFLHDGTGSIFPLKFGSAVDQREQEIWWQMTAYLNENYRNG